MRCSWVKIETKTPDKPEICIIASQLRLDADAVMGKLVRLWAWAEMNVSDSNETSVTMEFLDKLAGKKGFSAAMEKAGWLLAKGDKLIFPNFERHNGRGAKGRAQTALRVSRHRKRKSEIESNVTSEIESNVTSEIESNVTSEPIHLTNIDPGVGATDHNQSQSVNSVNSSAKALVVSEKNKKVSKRGAVTEIQNAKSDSVQVTSLKSVTDVTQMNAPGQAQLTDAEVAERKLSRIEKKDQIVGQKHLF
jgi:hypothetical protein